MRDRKGSFEIETMTHTTHKLDDLYYYLLSTEDEQEAELRERGMMETLIGDPLDSVEDAVEYWMGAQAVDLPAWAHLRDMEMVEDVELVHVTKSEHLDAILSDGFVGLTDMSTVATSTAHYDKPRANDGFVHAFAADEYDADEVEMPFWYGDVVVRFKVARALRVVNEFDDDDVIYLTTGDLVSELRVAE